jgi:fructose-bisphosphate aldolase class II
LRLASTGAIRRYLANNPAEFDPRKYFKEATKAMSDIVKARYEAFGCAGQASKIKVIGLEAMASRYSAGELDPTIS